MTPRRRRRWLLAVCPALLLSMAGGYHWATRPARVQAALASLFSFLDSSCIRFGRARLSLVSGLELRDVELSGDARMAARLGIDPQDLPPLLRIEQARVLVRPWALVFGRLEPRRIELQGAELNFIRNPRTDAASADLEELGDAADRGLAPGDLPALAARDVDIRIWAVEQGRPRLRRRWIVQATAERVGRSREGGGYAFRVRQTGGPGSPRPAAQAGRAAALPSADTLIELSWRRGEVNVSLGWLDLETLLSILPQALAQPLGQLELSGQACVDQLWLSAGGARSGAIRFANLSFALPIEELATGQEPFIQVRDATALLQFYRAEARDPINAPWAATAVDDDGPPDAAAIPSIDLPKRPSYELHAVADGRVRDGTAHLRLSATGIDLERIVDDTLRRPEAASKLPPAQMVQAELRLSGMTLPTPELHGAFIRSRNLPLAVRIFFKDYQPQGRFNLQAAATRGPPGPDGTVPPTRIEGVLEALGASCRYFRFPYRIEDVHGTVRFGSEGVYLEGLHGRHGSARIRADGKVNHAQPWTGLDLVFHAASLPLDEELFRALPGEYQGLWEYAAPVGLCDARVSVRRDEGSESKGAAPPHVQVAARLLGARVSLRDGRELEDVDARLTIQDGRLAIDDLLGRVDGGLVRLRGTMQAREQGDPLVDLSIDAFGMPLRRTSPVLRADGVQVGEVFFAGVSDAWGRTRSDPDSGAPTTSYLVQVRDGVLSAFDPQRTWRNVRGWLRVDPQRQQVIELAARRHSGTLRIRGDLPDALHAAAPVSFDLAARDGDFDGLLGALLPQRWGAVRRWLGFSGPGQLEARFHPRTSAEGALQAMEVTLSAQAMKPPDIPLEFHEVAARLTLDPLGFTLHSAEARCQPRGHISMQGQGGWNDGQQAWTQWSLQARDLPLEPRRLSTMPGPLGEFLRKLSPRGILDLTLDPLRSTAGAQRSWQAEGSLSLRHAGLHVGMPLTEMDGQLEGAFRLDPRGLELTARLRIDRGRLDGRPIERWEGVLRAEPGQRWLQLEDLQGRLCDGEALGSVWIDPDDGTYRVALTLSDLSLDQLMRRREAGAPGSSDDSPWRPGRLDGQVYITGRGRSPELRSGSGELRIRGGSFLNTPVLAKLAEANRRSGRTTSDALDLADLRFVLQGDELLLVSVDLDSRDLRLVGQGSWNMQTDRLELTLVGAHPRQMRRLPLLADLVEVAGQELMQYRVTGTARAPHVTMEPLHNLTDPLRRLLTRR